jgi:hypothetical protein
MKGGANKISDWAVRTSIQEMMMAHVPSQYTHHDFVGPPVPDGLKLSNMCIENARRRKKKEAGTRAWADESVDVVSLKELAAVLASTNRCQASAFSHERQNEDESELQKLPPTLENPEYICR